MSKVLKKCSSCLEQLPLQNFHKKQCGKYNVSARCKTCVKKWQKEYYNNKNKSERLRRQSSDEYQLYIRSYRLQKKYGITIDQYHEMSKKQNDKCAICGSDNPIYSPSSKYFSVDHNHITGKIRELLCGRCNLVIGQVYEDKTILRAMIDYIDKHDED